MKNTEYRNCIDCVFVGKNEYGIDCCTIDKITQVTYYGCIPQKIIDQVSAKFEEECTYLDKLTKAKILNQGE